MASTGGSRRRLPKRFAVPKLRPNRRFRVSLACARSTTVTSPCRSAASNAPAAWSKQASRASVLVISRQAINLCSNGARSVVACAPAAEGSMAKAATPARASATRIVNAVISLSLSRASNKSASQLQKTNKTDAWSECDNRSRKRRVSAIRVDAPCGSGHLPLKLPTCEQAAAGGQQG